MKTLTERYGWVDHKFKELFPDWQERLAMATTRKLFLDEDVAGSPLETELRKIFKHVTTLTDLFPKSTKDTIIIKGISGKGFIVITRNYDDFAPYHRSKRFDVIGVESIATSQAAAVKWARKIHERIGANEMVGDGTVSIHLVLASKKSRKRKGS